ncbi:bacteriohemerythrin [Desulfohalovibrio reitneri]|uniref:bacteriohemerythrin n=1 Tax=Desulfohalovibrio reitneri TaxID=1307759 RepID=UPI0004A780F9|nr:hemerythrin family protein [Desulfohalovibrio reitneri]
MPQIEWTDDLRIGVERIDAQHEKLTGLINELYYAYMQGREQDVLARTIREVSDYTLYHFADEEKLMAEIGYPELEAHKARHREFANKTIGFLLASVESGENLTPEVLDYLTDWWLNHIQRVDATIAEHIEKESA